jgi:hypothetical protein
MTGKPGHKVSHPTSHSPHAFSFTDGSAKGNSLDFGYRLGLQREVVHSSNYLGRGTNNTELFSTTTPNPEKHAET